MPAVLSLPYELLLDIFSLTFEPFISLDYEELDEYYSDRLEEFGTFALVHSTWRYPAQDLLSEDILIRTTKKRGLSDSDRAWMSGHLMLRKGFGNTKRLTIWGTLEEFFVITGTGMWSSLTSIVVGEATAMLETFAQFSNLTMLSLTKTWIGTVNYDKSLRFEHLRRLVIDKCQTFGGGGGDIRNYLTPEHMPRLAHLALKLSQKFAPAESFVQTPIFAEIKTFALSFDADTNKISVVLNELRNAKKLEHLSIFVMPQEQSILFNHPFPVKLESLHIDHLLFYTFHSPMEFVNDEALEWILDLTTAKIGKAKVERVVLHASQRPWRRDFPEHDLPSAEWREARLIPFADFDGK